jgi:hypothetical protein
MAQHNGMKTGKMEALLPRSNRLPVAFACRGHVTLTCLIQAWAATKKMINNAAMPLAVRAKNFLSWPSSIGTNAQESMAFLMAHRAGRVILVDRMSARKLRPLRRGTKNRNRSLLRVGNEYSRRTQCHLR